MKTWIKLYTKILDDPKIGKLSWAERGIWSSILALAGKLDYRDGDGVETGKLDTLENIAWHIRCPADELKSAIDTFIGCDMVGDVDGIYFVTNYGKHQAKPPSARPAATAERQRRYRERKARHNKNTKQGDDVTSSLQKTVTTRNGVTSSLRKKITPLDTESDTDIDTESVPETKTTADANASGASTKFPKSPEKNSKAKKVPEPSGEKAEKVGQALADLAGSISKQPAPNPTTKQRKKRSSKADPRTTSEEVERYRAVTGRYPPKPRYDNVIDALHWCNDEQAAAIYSRWKKSGYNPANPDWVEWAQAAYAPPAQGGKGNGNGRENSKEGEYTL